MSVTRTPVGLPETISRLRPHKNYLENTKTQDTKQTKEQVRKTPSLVTQKGGAQRLDNRDGPGAHVGSPVAPQPCALGPPHRHKANPKLRRGDPKAGGKDPPSPRGHRLRLRGPSLSPGSPSARRARDLEGGASPARPALSPPARPSPSPRFSPARTEVPTPRPPAPHPYQRQHLSAPRAAAASAPPAPAPAAAPPPSWLRSEVTSSGGAVPATPACDPAPCPTPPRAAAPTGGAGPAVPVARYRRP
jgi:hypothetical protein